MTRLPLHCRPSDLTAQRGAAVIEFALILPILLVLLLGVMDVSLALYNKAVITNASREGARAGIVARSNETNAQKEVRVRQVVINYTQSNMISFASAPPVPEVIVSQSTPATFPNPLQVTVRYTYQGIGLGKLVSALGQPWRMTSSTVMINE